MTNDDWQLIKATNSPIFRPLHDKLTCFKTFDAWPGLDDYNQLLQKNWSYICNQQGQSLELVPQDSKKQADFSMGYEPRIYHQGHLQTRENNWHDFFNFLVWATFPKSKALLNALQYQDLKKQKDRGSSQRTPLQNMLALFDECGIIVVSTEQHDLDLIENMAWQDLFVESKAANQRLSYYIFGHAIYEKSLRPYIGLTAKALLFKVEYDFNPQLESIDELLVKFLLKNEQVSPKDLAPLPILGIPGWYDKQTPSFYADQSYFRPKRDAKI